MYRNFIYLDTNTLNDYYSTIMGGLTDSQEFITKDSNSKSGKGGLPVVSASLESVTESESRKELISTDATKFNELYELMNSKGDIQYLDAFDEEIWNSIKRREILEIEVSVKIPELYKTMSAIEDAMPLIGLLEKSGQSLFKNDKEKAMMTGLMSMMNLENGGTIPLICESESTEGYKFIVELSKSYLRMDPINLNGEMTLLGKVQKIIPKNVEVEVFNMFPGLKPLMKLGDQNKNTSMEKLMEKITGPAMIIIPLAIYR